MILGVDVSAWNSLQTPYTQLKANGVEFCVVKGDQAASTSNHIALAKQAGMIVGEYFWHDPTLSATAQAADFLTDCAANKPDFVFLDVEQWWSDWNKWSQWIYQHTITQAQVPVMSAIAISNSAKTIMEQMTIGLQCPVGLYSAKWFIDGYAPGIATWLCDYPFWVASYITEAVHTATWDEIKAGPPYGTNPTMPSRVACWFMWQWSSHKKLPTTGETIDLNMFPGTLDNFMNWAGLTPSEPSDAEKLRRLWQAHPELW